jgi:hypothetical protein
MVMATRIRMGSAFKRNGPTRKERGRSLNSTVYAEPTA